MRQETPQRVRAALIHAVIGAAQGERRTLTAPDKTRFRLLAKQMHNDLFFDRHRDLCKLMGIEPSTHKHHGKDWRGASARIFEKNPLALMVAIATMS